MTIQTINLGNYANDGTGDDLRTAFTKVNANFLLLDAEAAINGGTNLGSGTGLFSDKNATNLEFKSLTSTDNSIAITHTSTTVNLQTATVLHNDSAPLLSANMGLNGHNIFGPGDVQTTVHGFDVGILNTLVQIALEANKLIIDLGTIMSPTGSDTNYRGYTLDMGLFTDVPVANEINFGTFI
jgi:hypothetical protein